MSSERQFDSHYLEQEPGAWNTSGSGPETSSQGARHRSQEVGIRSQGAGGYTRVPLQEGEECGGRCQQQLDTVLEDVHNTSLESGESRGDHSSSGGHSLSR